ncbi:hypothetical protein BS47DRAFT_1384922 [Hydnum rufescens UP504]|uniref:Uncharacterized protein n=1 Tax=Hydnum rufescens UP504 TaxID=1448309 RepID=A0A9P6ALB9_9AGAM|nr:hypothetical protein BS47DRAFT_1384922 [Hydnum rufescens UP504]
MSEPFRVQLSALQHLLQHILDSLTLPQQSEAVYPFAHSIDQDWLEKIESEGGVVNHDLELAFADHIVQKDTLKRLITFHEHGPSLEGVIDVIEKYWDGHPNDPLAKWVEQYAG